MPNKNFVTPREQQGNHPIQLPEALPQIKLDEMFHSEPTNVKVVGLDPIRHAIAFQIKYVSLLILCLVAVVSTATHFQIDAWIGCAAFLVVAVLLWIGLASADSFFSPYSAHVVRYIAMMIIYLAQIRANKEAQYRRDYLVWMDMQTRFNERQQLEHKAQEQVHQHSQPQSLRNQLANYQDADAFDDDDEQPTEWQWKVEDISPPAFVDQAREVILDFTISAYNDGIINQNGYIDNQRLTVPWSQRGLKQFDAELRKRIDRLIDDLCIRDGLYMYDEGKRQWRINIDLYPTADSAIEFINQIPSRVG